LAAVVVVVFVVLLLAGASLAIDIVEALFFMALESGCFIDVPFVGLFEGFSTVVAAAGGGCS
jgi:hypothetical protein